MASVPWGPLCLSCDHYRTIRSRPSNSNGYCAALNIGDWMLGETGVLWDGLKICGVRRDEEDEAAPVRFARRQRFHQPWPPVTVLFERGRLYQRFLPPRRPGWRIPQHRRRGSLPFSVALRSWLVAIIQP